jgi:hypothetical protein
MLLDNGMTPVRTDIHFHFDTRIEGSGFRVELEGDCVFYLEGEIDF